MDHTTQMLTMIWRLKWKEKCGAFASSRSWGKWWLKRYNEMMRMRCIGWMANFKFTECEISSFKSRYPCNWWSQAMCILCLKMFFFSDWNVLMPKMISWQIKMELLISWPISALQKFQQFLVCFAVETFAGKNRIIDKKSIDTQSSWYFWSLLNFPYI